jgi:hypothetical protein
MHIIVRISDLEWDAVASGHVGKVSKMWNSETDGQNTPKNEGIIECCALTSECST